MRGHPPREVSPNARRESREQARHLYKVNSQIPYSLSHANPRVISQQLFSLVTCRSASETDFICRWMEIRGSPAAPWISMYFNIQNRLLSLISGHSLYRNVMPRSPLHGSRFLPSRRWIGSMFFSRLSLGAKAISMLSDNHRLLS